MWRAWRPQRSRRKYSEKLLRYLSGVRSRDSHDLVARAFAGRNRDIASSASEESGQHRDERFVRGAFHGGRGEPDEQRVAACAGDAACCPARGTTLIRKLTPAGVSARGITRCVRSCSRSCPDPARTRARGAAPGSSLSSVPSASRRRSRSSLMLRSTSSSRPCGLLTISSARPCASRTISCASFCAEALISSASFCAVTSVLRRCALALAMLDEQRLAARRGPAAADRSRGARSRSRRPPR